MNNTNTTGISGELDSLGRSTCELRIRIERLEETLKLLLNYMKVEVKTFPSRTEIVESEAGKVKII